MQTLRYYSDKRKHEFVTGTLKPAKEAFQVHAMPPAGIGLSNVPSIAGDRTIYLE